MAAREEEAQRTAEDLARVVKEALQNAESITGVTVHEWPFEQDEDKWGFMMYVETQEPPQRFSISIREFYAFGSGSAYF